MNPFITLTTTDGHPVRINVNHIVAYDLRAFKKQYVQQVAETFTYILIAGGGHSACSRKIKETPEEIDELINHAIFNIPFTRTQLKGA